SYLLIISFSSTKLDWYDMPLYPLLAIVSGFSIYMLSKLFIFPSYSYLKQILFCLIIFAIPYFYAVQRSHDNVISPGEKKLERLAEYIFKKEKEGFYFDNWYIINTWFDRQLIFYKHKLQDKNQTINFANVNDLKKDDKVFLIDEENKKAIESKYEFKIIDTFKEVIAYKIIRVKEN
ncbi:MAG: hypothetical protein V1781_08930, partial [Bacteroidota bacterium]